MARADRLFLVIAGVVAVCGAQDAQQPATVEQATEDLKLAFRRSERAEEKFAEYIGNLPSSDRDAQAAADAIERSVSEKVAQDVKSADDEFKGHLAALESAEDGDAISKQSRDAMQASADVEQVGEKAAQAMKEASRQARAKMAKEAHSVAREAKMAARRAYKAATELEHVQRKSGVNESTYESDFLRHERAAERMMDSADDARGVADDRIDDFFQRVEERAEVMKEKTKSRVHKLEAQVFVEEQKAWARMAPEAEILSAKEEMGRWTPMGSVLLVALAAGALVAAERRRRRDIREQPLLG